MNKDNEEGVSLKVIANKDAAYNAELIWALKTVSADFSANSATGISEVFKKMFPEAVPKNFCLNPTKLSYLLTDALAPYFREDVLDEARNSFYSLQFDETTNSASKKELQIRIRFWSDKKNQVISFHLESFFIGHATAEDLKDCLLKSISNANLPLINLISISSDGPNVNKKVFRLLNEELIKLRGKGLIDIGTCTIHTVYNSFLKGLKEVGEDAADLIISVYNFFDGWPSRWEDFSLIQKRKIYLNINF